MQQEKAVVATATADVGTETELEHLDFGYHSGRIRFKFESRHSAKYLT